MKYARREIFSAKAKYVCAKMPARDIEKIDALAKRMKSQRAAAVRAAVRKGLAALRVRA